MKRTDSSKRDSARWSPGQRGFTLIELMVVVALVGILGTLAAPMFRSLIDANRVATELNGFVSDLQFARSEAIKQGLPVSVCPSSDGTSCATANKWDVGWIVFVDPTSAGTVPTGANAIRIRPAWKGNDTLVANPAMSSVTYNRDGFAVTPTGADVGFPLLPASLDTATAKCLVLNRAGQQTIKSYVAGACP